MREDALDQQFEHALNTMEVVVHELATLVPRPQFKDDILQPAFRYNEKSIQQAIVQKLARMVSTLHSPWQKSGKSQISDIK